MLMEAYWHRAFARVLESADLVTPDGMPLVWMLRLLGFPQQDRVAGMDLFLQLCDRASQENLRVFFLGSHSAVLERMHQRLRREFPDLSIVGMEPLPFRPLTPTEDRELVQRIRDRQTQIIFLALGCPKQENWMARHSHQLSAVTLGVGAVFPVYAGLHKRAPEWVRQVGLEWLYRLIQEPRRLWKRYAKTIPPFVWLASQQLVQTWWFRRRRDFPPASMVSVPPAKPRIGEALQQAGLLSTEQVETTLQLQNQHTQNQSSQQPSPRFGEILVQKGWVEIETVDFFAVQLPQLANHHPQHPIGYYLKSAGLLDDGKINHILQEQVHTSLRFGEIAVRKGYIKPETLNFLLQYIIPAQSSDDCTAGYRSMAA
jgi:N-acetylglucosaminyldiphosphoundecaprenol N-acetyl-beta-D-mannosaminyltransferase